MIKEKKYCDRCKKEIPKTKTKKFAFIFPIRYTNYSCGIEFSEIKNKKTQCDLNYDSRGWKLRKVTKTKV